METYVGSSVLGMLGFGSTRKRPVAARKAEKPAISPMPRFPREMIMNGWEELIWLDRRENPESFRPVKLTGLSARLAALRQSIRRMQLGPVAGVDLWSDRAQDERSRLN